MPDHPRVTIVVVTYCHGAMLEECLTSWLHQDVDDFEILVCDDASPDDGETLAVARRFAEADPRVRVLEAEANGGVSRNLNRGLDAARGDFIAIIAGDDAATPTRLRRQIEAMEADPDCALVYSDALLADRELDRVIGLYSQRAHRHPEGEGLAATLIADGNFVCGPTGMVRRSKVGDLRFDPRVDMTSDRLYWAACAQRGTVRYVDRPLSIYRTHPASMTARNDARARKAFEHQRTMFDIAEQELGIAPEAVARGRVLARWKFAKDCLRRGDLAEAARLVGRDMAQSPRTLARAIRLDQAARLRR